MRPALELYASLMRVGDLATASKLLAAKRSEIAADAITRVRDLHGQRVQSAEAHDLFRALHAVGLVTEAGHFYAAHARAVDAGARTHVEELRASGHAAQAQFFAQANHAMLVRAEQHVADAEQKDAGKRLGALEAKYPATGKLERLRATGQDVAAGVYATLHGHTIREEQRARDAEQGDALATGGTEALASKGWRP